MGLLVKIKRHITIPLKHIMHKKCDVCFNGYLIPQIEYINNTEITVYVCNKCNKKYI